MAASKSHPPKMPTGHIHPTQTGAAAKTQGPAKVRSGTIGPHVESVEVWTDEQQQRATGLLQILAASGAADPKRVPPIAPGELLQMYRSMLRIRIMDERFVSLEREGRIAAYSDARGQEAAIIGSVAATRADDWLVPAHREMGALLHRGLPMRAFVAHLLGNGHDIAKGRQVPGHGAAPRAFNWVPMSPCLATQLPQATGLAWAARMSRHDVVAIGYLGEGATAADDFHTGLNFAAVYKVPVVFICQNNGWALGMPSEPLQSRSETYAIKALAYGVEGVRVDGNDLFAVYAATRDAVERARRGEGPTMIEAVTTRLTAETGADVAAKDPLVRLRAYLRAQGLLDDAGDAEMANELRRDIEEALAAEERAEPPARHTLIDDVYAAPTAALREQLAELERVRARADVDAGGPIAKT